MEELIRFRLLNDELNNDEFNQFVSECMKSIGRKGFAKIIFKAFQKSPASIIPFTQITIKIINQRKPDPNKKKETNPCHNLNELPSELISKCAAFLETYEYITFSCANRKIYKSVYCFPQIQKISFDQFLNYPKSLSMNRLKNLTHLSIGLYSFNNTLSSSNQLIWQKNNKLNTLTIHAHSYNDDIEFNKLILGKQIGLENIKTLKLNQARFKKKSICDFLSNFPKLECLNLVKVCSEFAEDFDNDKIIKCLPNLRQFVYDNHNQNISNQILLAFNNKLQVLVLNHKNDCDIPPAITFPEVNELRLYKIENKEITILNRMSNLKTVKLDFKNQKKTQEIKQITKHFLSKIINTQLFLQHLSIHNADISSFNDLETAIFASWNKERKSHNLVIEFQLNWFSELMQKNKIDLYVYRLVTSLKEQFLHFVIKIKIRKQYEFDVTSANMKQWVDNLENMKQKYNIYYGFTKSKNNIYEFTFSISDKL